MTSAGYGSSRAYAGLSEILAACCSYTYQIMQMAEATQLESSCHSLQSHHIPCTLVICLSTLQKEIFRTSLGVAPLQAYVLWKINLSENRKDLDMPSLQH